MTKAYELLWEKRDEAYADFQAKLTPTVPRDRFIGVRVPDVRKLAKEYIKMDACKVFLGELPHWYYDENMLHGLIISEMKEFDQCIEEVDKFLPYIDNWAVCDIMSPKVFKKHKAELLVKINEWVSAEDTYSIRFGIEMLMTHFLDDDFAVEYLNIPAAIVSDAYYVNMMIAWFYATALAKQWDDAIMYIDEKRLGDWVHNKTIQKAIESRRISGEQKSYLRARKVR